MIGSKPLPARIDLNARVVSGSSSTTKTRVPFISAEAEQAYRRASDGLAERPCQLAEILALEAEATAMGELRG